MFKKSHPRIWAHEIPKVLPRVKTIVQSGFGGWEGYTEGRDGKEAASKYTQSVLGKLPLEKVPPKNLGI